MKKIILMGAMILVLRGDVLLGQATQKPYAYFFAGPIGDCTFKGVTFDQVWNAAVLAFMNQDLRCPVDLNRPERSMAGNWIWRTHNPRLDALRPFPTCRFNVLIQQEAEGVGVYCTATIADHELSLWFERENVQKAFFDKVAELLYGNVSIK